MTNLLLFVGTALLVMTTKSASTVITFASVGSIQQEGNAMADLARAIPGLTTLSGMDRLHVDLALVIYLLSFPSLQCRTTCDAIIAVI